MSDLPNVPSRRDVLRAGLGVTVLGALASAQEGAPAKRGTHVEPRPAPQDAPKGVPVPPDHRIKIGLIGCGGRGTGAAVQAASGDANCVIWALADIFPERMEQCERSLREHFSEDASKVEVVPQRRFAGVDGYRQLLESGVDVVCLCAFPHFRPAHVEASVRAGKHIFCEKPAAVDVPGLRRVRDACEAAKHKGLSIVCGFCWRYNDAMVPFMQELHKGMLGQVRSVHSTYHTSTLTRRPRRPEWSDMEFQLRNWWHFTWLSGDHIVEQACHSIDRMSWCMRDEIPTRCVGLGGRAAREGPEHGNVFDHFAVVYEYDDGRRCFMTTRQIDGCPGENVDHITLARGRGVCDGFSSRYELIDNRGTRIFEGRKDPESVSRMYQNEHDELMRSVRGGLARNDGEWMCRSTMLALMGRMACYTGQTVSWEQAWKSEENLTPPSYDFGVLPAPSIAVPGKTRLR